MLATGAAGGSEADCSCLRVTAASSATSQGPTSDQQISRIGPVPLTAAVPYLPCVKASAVFRAKVSNPHRTSRAARLGEVCAGVPGGSQVAHRDQQS